MGHAAVLLDAHILHAIYATKASASCASCCGETSCDILKAGRHRTFPCSELRIY